MNFYLSNWVVKPVVENLSVCVVCVCACAYRWAPVPVGFLFHLFQEIMDVGKH